MSQSGAMACDGGSLPFFPLQIPKMFLPLPNHTSKSGDRHCTSQQYKRTFLPPRLCSQEDPFYLRPAFSTAPGRAEVLWMLSWHPKFQTHFGRDPEKICIRKAIKQHQSVMTGKLITIRPFLEQTLSPTYEGSSFSFAV